MSATTELARQIETLERKKARAKRRLWWTGVLIAAVIAGGFAFWHYQPLFRLARATRVYHAHHRQSSPTPIQPEVSPTVAPEANPDLSSTGVNVGAEADTRYLLSGSNIVALFAIAVAGLIIRGGFAYGRIVNISVELANTKIHLEAGQIVTPSKSVP